MGPLRSLVRSYVGHCGSFSEERRKLEERKGDKEFTFKKLLKKVHATTDAIVNLKGEKEREDEGVCSYLKCFESRLAAVLVPSSTSCSNSPKIGFFRA